MQGSWTVRVKSKSASYDQRFVIKGASKVNNSTSGPFIYAGVVDNEEYKIIGDNWTISIQNNPGSGYRPSIERIKHPIISNNKHCVIIESDDSGGGDTDFNDLILECQTDVTSEDFLVYGNLNYYSDSCLVNPCIPQFMVIENWKALKVLMLNPIIKATIEKLYPEIIWRDPPIPEPDPPVFTPLMIPLRDILPVPRKKLQRILLKPLPQGKDKSNAMNVALDMDNIHSSVISDEDENTPEPRIKSGYDIDKIELASIFDRLRLNCETGPIANGIIKIFEYDRTASERAGAAYKGNGHREYLGFTQADYNGNYLFRFHKPTWHKALEAIPYALEGREYISQMMPDLILNLVDPNDNNNILYESPCYWNIPIIKRINVCIPQSEVGLIPFPCNGQSVIQRIGNTVLGPLNPSTGERLGPNNLTNEGIITTNHYLAPNVIHAAWRGNLALWGCLTNNAIKWYTIRYKPMYQSVWTMYSRVFTLPKYSDVGGLHLGDEKVGPFTRQLKLNTNNKVDCPAYINVETDPDPDWMESMRSLKAFINSNSLIGNHGPVDIRLEGFSNSGNKLADEPVTLYIDNIRPNASINPKITMGTIALGNCALFTLPKDSNGNTIENEPITVIFKAIQTSGFMGKYALTINKGAIGSFAVTPGVMDALCVGGNLDSNLNSGRHYKQLSISSCLKKFKGTISELASDGQGNYSVILTPSLPWLNSNQTFCAFSLNLNGNTRHTNGSTGNPHFHGGQVLIGIQR